VVRRVGVHPTVGERGLPDLHRNPTVVARAGGKPTIFLLGFYWTASSLLDTYGVHFDAALRDEVVARVDRLDLASYTAFVMPKLTPLRDALGEIVDVEIAYPKDFAKQMLEYGQV